MDGPQCFVFVIWGVYKLNLRGGQIFIRHPGAIRKNQLSLKMLGVLKYLIDYKNLGNQEQVPILWSS